MTRKNYQLFAKILRDARAELADQAQVGGDAFFAIDTIERKMIAEFAADNPNFKPETFKAAARRAA